MQTNQKNDHVYEIVEELGFFALAVSLAGYYVKQTPWLSSDLARYLPQYRQKRKEILSEKPRQAVHCYKANVLTTWETSFSAVQARSPSAANLFLLVCWLNPNDISMDLFNGVLIPTNEMTPRGVETLNLFKRILRLTEQSLEINSISSWFRCLQDYSLVRWEATCCSFTVHTLVQAWAQDRVDSERQEDFIELAIELLTSVIHFDPSDCRLRERLVSHFDRLRHNISERLYERLEKRLDGQEVVSMNLLDCLHSIGSVFLDIGRYALSMTVCQMEAAILTLGFGELDPRSLKAKSAVAERYLSCGLLRPARDLYEITLRLQSQVVGENHEDTICSLTGLGCVYCYLEDLDMAIKIQKVAVERWQSRPIEYNNESLKAQGRLAMYLRWHGDIHAATALSNAILRAELQLHDLDEGDLLEAMRLQAIQHAEAGSFETANLMSMEVVARRQTLLGKFQPQTYTAMRDVADFLGVMGRFAQEAEMRREIFKRAKEAQGIAHCETLCHLSRLADSLCSKGDHKRALILQTECVAFSYHSRDEKQWRYSFWHFMLTDILQRYGDYCFAVKALHKAYRKLSSTRDADCAMLLDIIDFQVSALQARGDHLATIALAQAFQDLMKRKLSEDHTVTLLASRRLVTLLEENHRWAEAQQEQETLLRVLSKLLDRDHPWIVQEKAMLVLTMGKRRKLAEAELLQREIVRDSGPHAQMERPSSLHILALILIARDAVGEGLSLHLRAGAMGELTPWIDQLRRPLSCQDLIRNLIQEDRFEAAEDFVDKVNAKCDETLGPNDTRTLRVRRWLADILASREKPSASSQTSTAGSTGPKRIVTYSITGRPMKILRWQLRPFIRRKVIIRLPTSQRKQWEDVSMESCQ